MNVVMAERLHHLPGRVSEAPDAESRLPQTRPFEAEQESSFAKAVPREAGTELSKFTPRGHSFSRLAAPPNIRPPIQSPIQAKLIAALRASEQQPLTESSMPASPLHGEAIALVDHGAEPAILQLKLATSRSDLEEAGLDEGSAANLFLALKVYEERYESLFNVDDFEPYKRLLQMIEESGEKVKADLSTASGESNSWVATVDALLQEVAEERESIEATSTQGLASAVFTNEFAADAVAYWNDDRNLDKPLRSLSDYLKIRVNRTLPHPCEFEYASGTSGRFRRQTWTIFLNDKDFTTREGITKLGDLEPGEVGGIVDTIYHEARHSEQYFRMAQVKAGEGKTPREIQEDLEIPSEVAQAASEPSEWADKPEEVAKAKEWEIFTIGKYKEYREQIAGLRGQLKEMKILTMTKITQYEDRIGSQLPALEKRIGKLIDIRRGVDSDSGKRDAADTMVFDHVQNIQSAFEAFKEKSAKERGRGEEYDQTVIDSSFKDFKTACHEAYEAYFHEEDARTVGEAAQEEFRRLDLASQQD